MNILTEEEKEVLSQCRKCVNMNCIHKDCFRRVSREHGGLELCYNMVAAKENKSEFSVVERYYDNGNCEVYICRYTSVEEKDRILEKYPVNTKCCDQYITYGLNFEEVRERFIEVQNT